MTPSLKPILARLPETVRAPLSEAVQAASWRNVRNALSAFSNCPPDQQGPEVTIHLLSSFNLEPIEPALQLGMRCVPCRPNLVIAPLDTIEQQMLDPGSMIYRGKTLATIILWRAEELVPDLLFPLTAMQSAERRKRSEDIIGRVRQIVQAYPENSVSALFVATLPIPWACGSLIQGTKLSNGLTRTISEINAYILEAGTTASRVYALDFNRWASEQGLALYDLQMDFMARQPFGTQAALSLGLFLARHIRPLLFPRRKVLAVDLDNTLWGGLLGEDGAAHLKLGRDFPGSVFSRIQREVLELKQQGVLLALSSKNEESEVRQALESMPDNLLHWEDFVCRKVNFSPKYLNLRDAAVELSLGLNSFAFLDDSDFEREQMRTFNPEVAIVNEAGDALHMLECLLRTDLFDAHHISEEDRQRHREYQLMSARVAQPNENIEDFLASLKLRARVENVGDHNLERVVQMLGKTNQFNVTTKRHQPEEVKRLLAMPGSAGLALRLSDRFGDQGIVGVLLAVPTTDLTEITVDSFLVSCRALGRGVEDVLWSEMTTLAARRGVKRLAAEFIPTARNGIVTQLFERLGMTLAKRLPDGTKRYSLELLQAIPSPAWIGVDRLAL